jgi:hypothetical protein
MAIQESTPGGGRFFAFGLITARNGASACNDSCTLGEDYSTAVGNDSWDNAHTFDSSNKGERLGKELNTLVQCTQHMGGSSDG